MIDTLIDHIKSYTLISKELENELENIVELKYFKKNDLIIKAGNYCQHFYFLQKGAIRSFYYAKDKERTYWIYTENYFFSSLYSFYTGEPSFENLEALEKCEVLSITKTQFQHFIETYPEFERFSRLFIEQQYAALDYFTKSFQDISAKEKYQYLLQFIPNIEQRAKLGHIASLLGITQETLSRIRAGK